MMHVDSPFVGLVSVAKGRAVKTLCYPSPHVATQLYPNGWRFFWFRPTGVR